jgi:hypothetical protein
MHASAAANANVVKMRITIIPIPLLRR